VRKSDKCLAIAEMAAGRAMLHNSNFRYRVRSTSL